MKIKANSGPGTVDMSYTKYRKGEYARYMRLQERLSKEIRLKPLSVRRIKTAGGIDCSLTRGRLSCACVVCERSRTPQEKIRVIEITKSWTSKIKPYVPGLFFIRELPVMLRTVRRLRKRPGVIFVNAAGIMHPRGCGLASHIGLLTGIPTIGITKGILCGKRIDDTVLLNRRRVAKVLKNKLVVSPGHLVDLDSSVSLTNHWTSFHRFPEPLYLADKLSKERFDHADYADRPLQ